MSKRPFACLPSALLVLCAIGAADATEPVASVRVAFDRDGITATRVHGMADTDTGRRVTAGDPVRIASIEPRVSLRRVADRPTCLLTSHHVGARPTVRWGTKSADF
jgi:hypothetical protein